jgi:hypothetical protein
LFFGFSFTIFLKCLDLKILFKFCNPFNF